MMTANPVSHTITHQLDRCLLPDDVEPAQLAVRRRRGCRGKRANDKLAFESLPAAGDTTPRRLPPFGKTRCEAARADVFKANGGGFPLDEFRNVQSGERLVTRHLDESPPFGAVHRSTAAVKDENR